VTLALTWSPPPLGFLFASIVIGFTGVPQLRYAPVVIQEKRMASMPSMDQPILLRIAVLKPRGKGRVSRPVVPSTPVIGSLRIDAEKLRSNFRNSVRLVPTLNEAPTIDVEIILERGVDTLDFGHSNSSSSDP